MTTRLHPFWKLKTLPYYCPQNEQVVNGNFDTGDFTGWTGYQHNLTTQEAHSLPYSAFMYENWIMQTFAKVIRKDCLTSAKFWALNLNAVNPHLHTYTIYYSDGTSDTVSFYTYDWNVWHDYDILPNIADGKFVSAILFQGDTGQPYCLDDVSLVC